jgi:phosphoribosyl-ATP pyrophosphohydrolase/phosphoribosyl-AMP cyclohydrolase
MIDKLNFGKLNGLVPAIIQDASSSQVLMVGFMNRDAVAKTIEERLVTFWSRTKSRLWRKGETSGNTLAVVSIAVDCDGDALLIKANPAGPVCHTGTFTCFGEEQQKRDISTIDKLEEIIRDRAERLPSESYTASLLQQGTGRIAQKVGEEAVETVVAAMQKDREAVKEESADLLYHLLVLLRDQGISVSEVGGVLRKRMEKRGRSKE